MVLIAIDKFRMKKCARYHFGLFTAMKILDSVPFHTH